MDNVVELVGREYVINGATLSSELHNCLVIKGSTLRKILLPILDADKLNYFSNKSSVSRYKEICFVFFLFLLFHFTGNLFVSFQYPQAEAISVFYPTPRTPSSLA